MFPIHQSFHSSVNLAVGDSRSRKHHQFFPTFCQYWVSVAGKERFGPGWPVRYLPPREQRLLLICLHGSFYLWPLVFLLRASTLPYLPSLTNFNHKIYRKNHSYKLWWVMSKLLVITDIRGGWVLSREQRMINCCRRVRTLCMGCDWIYFLNLWIDSKL